MANRFHIVPAVAALSSAIAQERPERYGEGVSSPAACRSAWDRLPFLAVSLPDLASWPAMKACRVVAGPQVMAPPLSPGASPAHQAAASALRFLAKRRRRAVSRSCGLNLGRVPVLGRTVWRSLVRGA